MNPYQIPPFSQDAEEAVIGSILVNPPMLASLAFLQPKDFFLVRNQYVWDAFISLQMKAEPIDYLTVVNEIKTQRSIDDIGGEVYLIGLFRNTPTSVNAEAYGRIVERAAMRRNLMAAADEIRGFAMNENLDLEQVISECDNSLFSATSRHVSARQWEFLSRSELLSRPPVEWLIPRVLPVRSLAMIFGQSGSFKSFYALDKSIDVSQHHNVLYVVAEGESGMPARLQAHERHFRRDTTRLTFCMGAVDMFSDVELMAFKRLAARHQPSLVVVDTFAMCTGSADENNTRDMKAIVDGCKRMIVELGCSVLVVHHTNKEGRVERGNASFRNACETVIRLSLNDDVIKVEHQKSKDKALPAPEYYRRVIVNLGYKDSLGEEVTSVVLEPSERVLDGNEMTEKQKSVLRALIIEPSATVSEIAEIVESTRGAVSSIIERLTKKGWLSAWDGKGRVVTASGLAMLGDSSDSSDSSDSRGVQTPSDTIKHTNQRISQASMFGPRNQYDRGN